LRRTAEADMPGLVDKRVPFVFPPKFHAEARVRALFIKFSGGVTDETKDQTFDFVGDLGYVEQGTVVESMVRLQFGRLSIRGVYDAYLRTFRGAGGRFDWPGFHYGFDFDLYKNSSTRFGLDMDFYRERPAFVVNRPPGLIPAISITVEAPRPATAGVYFVTNPINLGSVSCSFETRARRSLRTGSKIDEVEVATGLLTPQTVLGVVGLRGGYRYTNLELQHDQFVVEARWSGVFGELVCYY
jgi:hypothetical protein